MISIKHVSEIEKEYNNYPKAFIFESYTEFCPKNGEMSISWTNKNRNKANC